MNLDVYGAGKDDGATVIQYNKNGGTNQQFDVEALGDGSYSIRAAHSGKSLDVFQWNTNDGAELRQWTYNGTQNQRWRIDDTGKGLYSITSAYSNKVLDVWQMNRAAGAQIKLYHSTGGPNQKWSFIRVGSNPTPTPAPTPAPTPTPVPTPVPGLAAPTGLTSKIVDNASVTLSWSDKSNNETGFTVERRNKADTNWTLLTKTAANVQTYADSAVAMGSDYEYRVSAFNAAGNSANVALPVSIPSLLSYGKSQYELQSCGACHGVDGKGASASALNKYKPADIANLTSVIAKTMPPPASPAKCTSNCAAGTARYIVAVLSAGNNGGVDPEACKGTPPEGGRSLRLLTRQEYQNTVNDLLGLSTSLTYQLPEENRVDGFDNHVATNLVTGLRLEAYMSQAESLASQAVKNSFNKLVPCGQQNTACAEQFITKFGKRAYRRPLTANETNDFLNNFSTGAFSDAVTTTVAEMLSSPHFLYRSELGVRQSDGTYKLTPYETATALSYLFLGSLPDDPLFSAADQNQLDTPEQRLAQATRLLGMSKSRQQVGNFVGQWLLSSSPYALPDKDKNVYPRYTADVKAALSQELIGFFNHVAFDSTQTFPELFTSNYVWANKTLADYYGLSGVTGSNYQVVPVKDGTRTGIMTLGAVLSRYANSNESHPFKRGGFLYKRLLCHDLLPPANAGLVKTPKPNPNATTRERFDFHSKSGEVCLSCHRYLDPAGFGFENYDGAGIYRATENGQTVSTAGTLLGMETYTPTEKAAFSDLNDLSAKVSTSPQAAQCVARQYYRYTMGRREATADSCALKSFTQTYTNSGYNLQTMLLGIVNAPGFNLRNGSGQ